MEARHYPALHFSRVISPTIRFLQRWQAYGDLSNQDKVASSPPYFHESIPKAGILQKIISGFSTTAWHEKA